MAGIGFCAQEGTFLLLPGRDNFLLAAKSLGVALDIAAGKTIIFLHETTVSSKGPDRSAGKFRQMDRNRTGVRSLTSSGSIVGDYRSLGRAGSRRNEGATDWLLACRRGLLRAHRLESTDEL